MARSVRRRVHGRRALVGAALAALLGASVAAPAAQAAAESTAGKPAPNCAPGTRAVGFSDALDKVTVKGVQVGGLSAITYDERSRGYVSVVDRSGTLPAQLWFFRDPGHPQVTGSTLLTKADGTPYDGTNFDAEGLAVLPDGRFIVSSESEPSIRIFGRDGVERAELPVPARFRVSPAGEATDNGTLEGLGISPDGQYVYAAMEDTLSGDVSPAGEAAWRRILVYRADRHHDYRLVRQIGYKVDEGLRIAEIAPYGDGRFVVLEAAFTANVGNTVRLYAVTGADRARDVTPIGNLSAAPARSVIGKRLVADLVDCPTLGATSPEPQINPLLDNYEALTVDRGRSNGKAEIHLVSDDNFNPIQVTRVLTLQARLP
ncbi:esterase-like activity of phytase family protein [Micromonospora sp. 15K316]|uniref:esterase-like activity of phytase family protein n=1 Tax=Micromonospora sp. 15K316 TaxID=2530376 RepID=UPI001A9EE7EC|nr:esterase-like activity of phytase family protein [Micromonospora sp. 15K316]